MKAMKLFVQAPNVHQGGGRALLMALIGSLPNDVRATLCLDQRLVLPDEYAELTVKRVPPSIFQRFLAERWLSQTVHTADAVICFGNLPPLFKVAGHVTVFVQNRYLIDDTDLASFPLKTRLRLVAERLWLRSRMGNVDEFVVQTPSMKKLLEARTDKPVRVLPFMERREQYARQTDHAVKRDGLSSGFLYVASGEPHKNHRRLIEAWCLLAEQGLFPSLKLTLDEAAFPELCAWLREKIVRHGLKIENLGCLPHEKVLELYKQAHALVYPSTFESFGLPLIEGRQAGLSILASELDYVRDVIDPEETFDPSSSVSIARAVKRFLGESEAPLPLSDARGFLRNILERAQQGAFTYR